MTSLIRRRWLVVAVLAGASAGCSLIADLSQFDGYVDAATDGGGGKEVGIDKDTSMGSEESTLETGTDDASDAGPAGDGASPADADASIVADVNTDAPSILGNSWCSQNFDDSTVLCADFDEPRISNDTFLTYPYGGQWMVHDFGGTDGLDRVDYAPGSAPNALEVVTQCTTATPTAGCVTGYTQEQLIDTVVAPHGVIFSYAVKIENYDLDASSVSAPVIVGSIPTGAPRSPIGIFFARLPWRQQRGQRKPDCSRPTWTTPAPRRTRRPPSPSPTSPIRASGGSRDDGGDRQAPSAPTRAAGMRRALPAPTRARWTAAMAAPASAAGSTSWPQWISWERPPRARWPAAPASRSPTTARPPFRTEQSSPRSAPPNPAGGIQIVIGANYIQAPAQAMTLLYDNVKVEALP